MDRLLYTLALVSTLVAASIQVFAQPQDTPVTSIAAEVPAPSILGSTRQITLSALPMLSARLNLTEAQQTQIRSLLQAAEKAAAPQIEAQKRASKAFADALVAGAGEAELTALAKAAMQAESEVLAQRIRTLSALRALLDEDQKKQFSNMMERTTMPWRGIPVSG